MQHLPCGNLITTPNVFFPRYLTTSKTHYSGIVGRIILSVRSTCTKKAPACSQRLEHHSANLRTICSRSAMVPVFATTHCASSAVTLVLSRMTGARGLYTHQT